MNTPETDDHLDYYSNTPESDAATFVAMRGRDLIDAVYLDFAEKLETERNEARKQRDELLTALEELSGLCERSWGTAIVGKPIRNQALKAIANVKGDMV